MKKQKLYAILFTAYLVFLVFIIILKFDGSFDTIFSLRQSILNNRNNGILNINLIPFKSISPYIKNITEFYAFKNIMGNIVVFIPMGFFTAWFCNKKLLKTLLYCIIMLLSIEIMQFIFMIGFFDIDDLILNLTGCVIGYLIKMTFYIFTKNR